jgi:hypothetical protein
MVQGPWNALSRILNNRRRVVDQDDIGKLTCTSGRMSSSRAVSEAVTNLVSVLARRARNVSVLPILACLISISPLLQQNGNNCNNTQRRRFDRSLRMLLLFLSTGVGYPPSSQAELRFSASRREAIRPVASMIPCTALRSIRTELSLRYT